MKWEAWLLDVGGLNLLCAEDTRPEKYFSVFKDIHLKKIAGESLKMLSPLR